MPLSARARPENFACKVTDPSGLGVKAAVQFVSETNDYRNTLTTDDAGALIAKRLPFGLYRIEIEQPGFAEVSAPVEVRSAIPITTPSR